VASAAVAVASVAAAPRAVLVPDSVSRSGWGRAGHRRAVLIGAVVAVVVLGGGVAAWAEVGGTDAGYRMATVTRTDIGTTLDVVGTVDPVADASAAFQVEGQVATVSVTPGQVVTAGQTLGTLDTTALTESVSSAQSTVAADEAKLVEDEESESSSTTTTTTPSAGKTQASTPSSSTTTTTTPTRTTTGGQSATVTTDQSTLTADQSTLSTDQNKEAADLSQAQSDCTTANTSTTSGQATCESALQTVSTDEQQVSKDQTAVSKDETALGQALEAGSSGGTTGNTGSGTGSGSGGGSGSHAVDDADISGTGASTDAGTSGTGSTGDASTGAGAIGGTGSSGADADTPQQIASDQAAIDSAEADLINAEQSLNEATLTSPISGTVVSVDIAQGDTVSADSSSDVITVIGTKSYEVQGTLDSSQVPSVKVGQSATVEVDGVDSSLKGTIAQVGPVQSSDGEYTYPVVISLPGDSQGLFTGSTANVVIDTGSVSNVVAVPTSAVETTGNSSYVLLLDKGILTRKVIKIGMVGDTYTQVVSGLKDGQSIILADYAQAVPSSNTDLTTALGGGSTGFGGFGGFGGGAGGFTRGAGITRSVAGGAGGLGG
jgi:multidrug efflux pump subunit AcrA (membrane-fusion protein)